MDPSGNKSGLSTWPLSCPMLSTEKHHWCQAQDQWSSKWSLCPISYLPPFPMKLRNKVIKKIMKIDNDCLRTSGNSTFKEQVKWIRRKQTTFLRTNPQSIWKAHCTICKTCHQKRNQTSPWLVLPIWKASPSPYQIKKWSIRKTHTDINNQLLKDARNLLQREKRRAKKMAINLFI